MHYSRIFSLLGLLLSASVGLQAQLAMTGSSPIVMEDTIECVGSSNDFAFTNVGSEELELSWRKIDLQVPAGWSSYLCSPIGCHLPLDEEPLGPDGSLLTFAVSPGEAVTEFVLRYQAEENAEPGTLIYQVEVYDVNNPSINLTCEVQVNGMAAISTSIQEAELQQLTVYPNPASEVLFNRAPAEYTAWLIDMTGRQLANIPANGLDVSEFGAGLYLVSWEKEGQVLRTEPILIN